jgi:hypothetical protein
MNFTLFIYSLTDTTQETFTNCHATFNKSGRVVEIEDGDGKPVVDYFIADSDRVEIRYHA